MIIFIHSNLIWKYYYCYLMAITIPRTCGLLTFNLNYHCIIYSILVGVENFGVASVSTAPMCLNKVRIFLSFCIFVRFHAEQIDQAMLF